jgi:CelD/BcsL family acetyltransferase involved in cellulose biosynthesis
MAVITPRTATVETISTLDGLETLAPEWDALVRATPRPSPFMLHAWVTEWWRHHGDGVELAVHVARRDGRLLAALPLVVRKRAGLRVTRSPMSLRARRPSCAATSATPPERSAARASDSSARARETSPRYGAASSRSTTHCAATPPQGRSSRRSSRCATRRPLHRIG